MSEPAAKPPASPRWRYYSLLLACFAAIALYMPGITGPFIHDDTGQITANDDIKIDRVSVAALRHSADHYPSRPLPMASFAINHAMCGLEPSCFKMTNIVVHAATGIALYLFLVSLAAAGARRNLFTIPGWLPVVVTTLWLLHPLNVSTVLYIVQRMTQLATLFSLLALAAWLQARYISTTTTARAGWLAAALTSLLLGLLSKEIAVLVLPLALLLEILLLTPEQRQRIPRPGATGWVLAALALGGLALLAFFPTARIAGSYIQRDYLPPERLLTEARILWYYVGEIAWPDQARMSFFLDIFPVSRSLLAPWTTLVAVGAWFVVLGAAMAALLRGPSLVAFGILFFATGHLIESSVLGLALVYEHRNYGPEIGLLLAAAAAAYPLLRWPALRVACTVAALAFCSWQLVARVDVWSSDRNFAAYLALPRWAASYTGTLDVAYYYDRQAAQLGDNPMLARLYRNKAVASYERATRLSSQPYAPLSILVLRAGSAQEQADTWQRLFAVAATQPVTFDALNWANAMATCQLVETCPVLRPEFAHYLDLLIANPRAPADIHASLQRAAGTLYTKVYGNPEKGIALAREAAASGRVDARESLIKNLAFLGRTAEARAEYERLARDVDLGPLRRQRIESAIAQPGKVVTEP